MARPTMLVFDRMPKPEAERWYLLLVEVIEIENGVAHARLRHLDPELEGLVYDLERKMPLSPCGPFGALVQACGVVLGEEARIDPRVITGKTVRGMFAPDRQGLMSIVDFAPCEQELDHDSE